MFDVGWVQRNLLIFVGDGWSYSFGGYKNGKIDAYFRFRYLLTFFMILFHFD